MTDIAIAIKTILANQPMVQRYINYYEGLHPLTFASEKFRTTFGRTLMTMRDNLCPIVVESLADRMEIINFSGQDADDSIAKRAWDIWVRNLMPLYSNTIHREAIKTGVGYLLVWQDEAGNAVFYPQDARQCLIIEDEETGTYRFGAKMWQTETGEIRLTLYYQDRIEKYITAAKASDYATLKDTSFEGFNSDTENEVSINPYNTIPLFKFKANPILSDCIPIQDALNKTICDKLVAMEFAAYPQRHAVGLEIPVNEITGERELPFKAGVDRLWFSSDKETKFGEFGTADLTQFIAVADSLRLEMARISGVPLHFFSIQTGNAVSGEALKTLESRFTKRIKRLCLSFGEVWANVANFALRVETGFVGASSADANRLAVQWDAIEQRSEKEFLESLLLKKELGVAVETLFEELGYTAEDIAKFGRDGKINNAE